tara:strand:+ start:9449 stop:10639 length:1191 start_codon:yes stop_codon:yes gene_type:complete
MSTDRSILSPVSRREALLGLASFLAASPLLRAQQDPSPLSLHHRVPGFSEMLTPWDFEPVFRANVPRAVYDYTAHGTDSEFTLRRNRDAFDWVKLKERRSISKNSINTSLTLFGNALSTPLMLAPTARQRPLHSDGELAMYEAATRANQTMIVSHASSFPFDRIAKASHGPLWFQFYPRPDRVLSEQILADVQTAGASAVVVTIDQQASSYERALHNRHLGGAPRSAQPPSLNEADNPYGVRSGRLWYDWQYLDDIRPMISVPVLAKGILTAEGARRCLDIGFDGIVVSNHGGRALDYGPSTLEVLQEVVAGVGGRVPVLIDSGFRRGTDVVKALALGATAVCLGRVPRWGLGAFGVDGAHRVLDILQTELIQTMSTIGCRTLDEIDDTVVTTKFI